MTVQRLGWVLVAAACFSLLPSTLVWGQERPARPPQSPGPGMMEMMQRMQRRGGGVPGGRIRMHAFRNPAEAVLRLRERLALTDEQVRRLEALATSQREALRPSGPDLLRARADLLEATSPDIDLDAARAALERLSRLRTDAALARLRARKEVRDVLTAEQRSKLDDLGVSGAGRMGPRGRPPHMPGGGMVPPLPEQP